MENSTKQLPQSYQYQSLSSGSDSVLRLKTWEERKDKERTWKSHSGLTEIQLREFGR